MCSLDLKVAENFRLHLTASAVFSDKLIISFGPAHPTAAVASAWQCSIEQLGPEIYLGLVYHSKCLQTRSRRPLRLFKRRPTRLTHIHKHAYKNTQAYEPVCDDEAACKLVRCNCKMMQMLV